MARSAEKAASELSRWYKYKMEKEGHWQQNIKARPYLATECHVLKEANAFRREIIQEISTNVTTIQNAQLGEFRLRDLNDHINKLIREKKHWEERIKELGGSDYAKSAPKLLTRDGKEVPGNRGYRYFGAARDLPGVRELFEIKKPEEVPKTRTELMKFVDADYFGYRDEDDGIITSLENDAENRARKLALEKWRADRVKEDHMNGVTFSDNKENDNYLEDEEEMDVKNMIEYREIETGEGLRPAVSHVEVPTQAEVQEAILIRKKRELMERYAADSLKSDNETRKALGLPVVESGNFVAPEAPIDVVKGPLGAGETGTEVIILGAEEMTDS